MYGQQAFVGRVGSEEYKMMNEENGFWGSKSPEKNNWRVQGLLIIYRQITRDSGISVRVQLLEHKSRDGNLCDWFPNIPDKNTAVKLAIPTLEGASQKPSQAES
jgi:hypothetical protein